MREIILHGSLASSFGDRFRLAVETAAEAVHALSSQLPGFRETIAQGNWHVVRGDTQDSGNYLTEDELTLGMGRTKELHLIPAAQGAKSGILNTIIGATLIAVGTFVPGMQPLIAVGVGMLASGVAQMMMSVPSPEYADREKPSERPSFLFKGSVNTSTQGLPVPLVYGRIRTGSVVISAGLSVEEIT